MGIAIDARQAAAVTNDGGCALGGGRITVAIGPYRIDGNEVVASVKDDAEHVEYSRIRLIHSSLGTIVAILIVAVSAMPQCYHL